MYVKFCFLILLWVDEYFYTQDEKSDFRIWAGVKVLGLFWDKIYLG